MNTICEKHNEISKIANQRFYRNKLTSYTEKELHDIIEEMEYQFKKISNISDEAKVMWQKMEDWLRRRKYFMEGKLLEEEYQLT